MIPVRVAVRCGPLRSHELPDKGLQFSESSVLHKDKRFWYDDVFGPDTAQDEVYEKTVKNLVHDLFQGKLSYFVM